MHDPVALHFYIKTSLALLAAIGVLAPCGWFAIGPKVTRPIPIENFIAFNLTVFIVLGFAVTIAGADRWPAACIWAGAAMLSGGVIGVLFGIPTATDAHNNQTNQDAVKDALNRGDGGAPVLVPARGHTLMADTAGWMSKFLAGAGFAQARSILNAFTQLSRSVAGYLAFPPAPQHATALAAGVLLYFLLVGFFCGLIVPYYYVKNLPGT